MNAVARRYPIALNVLVIAVTIVFVSLVLVVGRATAEPRIELSVGEPAPQTFTATRAVEVDDEAATEKLREEAVLNTEQRFSIDPTVSRDVQTNLRTLLGFVELNAFEDPDEGADFEEPGGPPQSPTTSGVPDEETTTTATSTTVAPTTEAPTTAAPSTTAAPGEGDETTTSSTTTTSTEPPTTTTTLPLRDLEAQLNDILKTYPSYADDLTVFVTQFNLDVERRENGEREVFRDLETEVIDLAAAQMEQEIKGADVPDVKDRLLTQLPFIFAPGLSPEELPEVRRAVANIVADSLLANYFPDPEATAADQEANAAAVPIEKVQYFTQQEIVAEGERVTAVQLEAINELELLIPEPTTSRNAIVALGGMAVLLAAFFLWRVAPNLWSQPRHFALLGILLVLAAAATRIPEIIVTEDNTAIAYILPAVMFGYMGAILYDPRTALLLAIPVATFTAISSADPALTIFAASATVVPVAFVSAVSSRRQLRLAVGMSALVLAPLAASIAWLFDDSSAALPAAAFAVVGGIVGGLVAQGLLSFLENLFRMTTTLTLLDLTDRNHPGLSLLEEKAPGTFNHSILVGTLAGKAARAIGAQPLLAQAAAYYHDLGKTENPQYFIENQFGVSNPHDEIDPVASAEIIRTHVLEGERLARQLRIPETVADGIRMHHGTGLMRYFYHQALEGDPTVDPEDFRHAGTKPRRKEMAILMISDAVEGAARSLAQHEDPTAASIVKMVDSVVGEKLEDGQLDESDLTFGDLTKVKQALVDALIGYYHTRIPYPGFPGAAVEAE